MEGTAENITHKLGQVFYCFLCTFIPDEFACFSFFSPLWQYCWFQHKSKPESVVVSYLVFIKQHSSSGPEFSDIHVPVLTSKGLLCPATERVHFPEEYGNISLPKKLPGREDINTHTHTHNWAFSTLLLPYWTPDTHLTHTHQEWKDS